MAFTFSRKGIRFSGKTETFAGVVRAEFELSREGRKIADTLRDTLRASVTLYDEEKRRRYPVARDPERVLSQGLLIRAPHRGCSLETRINARWKLIVWSQHPLHPDAESVLKWAAAKLEPYVPDKAAADDQTDPPVGGGGGSGGSAEIGIPIWWAHKARG